MTELDIDFVREQFPVFQNPKTSNFAFFENAGGTYVPKQVIEKLNDFMTTKNCLLYTSPSPRDRSLSRMPSSA